MNKDILLVSIEMYTSILYKDILKQGVAILNEMYIAFVRLKQLNRRAHGFGENSNDY